MKIEINHESFPVAGVFSIARGSKTLAEIVTVILRDGTAEGWGESVPYARYGETVRSVMDQLASVRSKLHAKTTLADIQTMLPAGAARNALDCAMWDLQTKKTGVAVYAALGFDAIKPVTTAYTLSLDSPENMAIKARENAHRPILKIKLDGKDDLERVAAIHANAPKSQLIVDANEGWSLEQVVPFSESLARYNVVLIEQPLPAGVDGFLGEIAHPIPICADESVHDSATLQGLVGLYDVINIKTDKTGGLTEAMKLRQMAEQQGMGVMVGCMLGTSLAMAPAMILAQNADFVDLDGPLWLLKDRDHPLIYDNSQILPPNPKLWG